MPFNPQTGQWESEVLPNPPAPPPMPQQTPYNPDPQDAIERVRLAQDLDASGLGTRDIKAVQSRVRPDMGINIRGRNLVKGSTMEAIRPYLALLYKQVADTPLGDQPHQRALGIAARIGVGGYLGAQQAREASNADAVKSAEELQKERRTYIGTRASELAKHRWKLEEERRAAEGKNPMGGASEAYINLDTPEKVAAFKSQYPRVPIPPDNKVMRSWLGPEKEKETKTSTVDFAPFIETNVFGHKFFDQSKLTGLNPEDRTAALKAARDAGAAFVSPKTAEALGDVDTAALNIRDLKLMLDSLLPKDPTGRVVQTPGITMSRLFQTNADRAAWGAQRGRAIQMLRAAAGSKGLRINQAEIMFSIANDIPQLNDTYEAGMAKLNTVLEQIQRVAEASVTQDRSKLFNATPATKAESDAEAKAVRDAVLGGGK